MSLAALGMCACGTNTLQGIDGPGPGTGGGGAERGSGGSADGAGGGTKDLMGPLVAMVSKDGVSVYSELDRLEARTGATLQSIPADESPRAVTQVDGHLVLASAGPNENEAVLRQYDHLVNQDGSYGFVEQTLSLEPVGAASQLVGQLGSDDQGGLWMLSTGVSLGAATPSNALYWSSTGSVGGPWVRYELMPAAQAWAVLPGAYSMVVSTNDGLKQLALWRGGPAIEHLADLGPATYPALDVYRGDLFGITHDCDGCTGSGQLHIWRGYEVEVNQPRPVLGGPDVILELPEDLTRACSLTVGREAVVVGACTGPELIPQDPKLFVYRDPDTLGNAAVPDDVVTLSDEPVELASYHGPTVFGARLSVYVRTPGHLAFQYDDRGGALAKTDYTLATTGVTKSTCLDIHLFD